MLPLSDIGVGNEKNLANAEDRIAAMLIFVLLVKTLRVFNVATAPPEHGLCVKVVVPAWDNSQSESVGNCYLLRLGLRKELLRRLGGRVDLSIDQHSSGVPSARAVKLPSHRMA
jgi:hypothetical protein